MIELRTRQNNPISNEQFTGHLPYKDIADNIEFMRTYLNCCYRTEPTGIYNCHGLTFASRRTRIYDNTDLRRILFEDGYFPVNDDSIYPGDIILYVNRKGDIIHSGFVLNVNKIGDIKIPMVLSKWGNGSEVCHAFNNCPYYEYNINIEYHRVK